MSRRRFGGVASMRRKAARALRRRAEVHEAVLPDGSIALPGDDGDKDSGDKDKPKEIDPVCGLAQSIGSVVDTMGIDATYDPIEDQTGGTNVRARPPDPSAARARPPREVPHRLPYSRGTPPERVHNSVAAFGPRQHITRARARSRTSVPGHDQWHRRGQH